MRSRSPVELLHAAGHAELAQLDDQVVVVRHQAIRRDRPVEAPRDDRQSHEEHGARFCIPVDRTIAAYCLMTNHYHLVVKLGELGMARGMQQLNGGYAIAFNARHSRRDHLFGRRYWSRKLEDEDDLLETCRYIELNPVRKAMTSLPEDWHWSSHRAAVGLAHAVSLHSPAKSELFDPRPHVRGGLRPLREGGTAQDTSGLRH